MTEADGVYPLRGIHEPTQNAKAWRKSERLKAAGASGRGKKTSRARVLEDRGQMGLGFSVSEMTAVPQSDWVPPDLSSLPDQLHGIVGVDLETDDAGLRAGEGGGWAWDGGGRVIGYSITADNWSGYLPIGHVDGNVDPDQARRWLNHVLGRADQTKVYAHAMYDLGWSWRDGVDIRGPAIDVQWVEAMLDEYRLEYSLNAIAKDRLGEEKDEGLLRKAAQAYGVDPKSDMSKLPSKYVGPYAEWDSVAPRRIWQIQKPVLDDEELGRVFDLEHKLLPLYIDMRRRGVRIDVDYAERLRDQLAGEVQGMEEEIGRRVGRPVSIWAARSIGAALTAEGIRYQLTSSGEPSITRPFLEGTDHWLTKMILSAREKDKLVGTFLDGQILGALHAGRVHGQVHPMRSDDGGTVTGRLSMSDPNLQFIPTRTEEGKKIRRAFVPEDGELWASLDHSQQEPRLTVHYAYLTPDRWGNPHLPGSAEARQRYVDDPDMSYHEFAAELTGLPYKAAKILNLAIIYGRGVKETAGQLGKSMDEVKSMFARHHQEMPFAKALAWKCQDRVKEKGYIRSLSGRWMRFPLWEPEDWDDRDGRMLTLDLAEKAWPGNVLTRARLHKALNSLIQPSAADQMKMGMLAVHEAGYGRRVLFSVHDELDCSVPDHGTAETIAGLLRDAVHLEVPSKVSIEIGPNWMEQKKDD